MLPSQLVLLINMAQDELNHEALAAAIFVFSRRVFTLLCQSYFSRPFDLNASNITTATNWAQQDIKGNSEGHREECVAMVTFLGFTQQSQTPLCHIWTIQHDNLGYVVT